MLCLVVKALIPNLVLRLLLLLLLVLVLAVVIFTILHSHRHRLSCSGGRTGRSAHEGSDGFDARINENTRSTVSADKDYVNHQVRQGQAA